MFTPKPIRKRPRIDETITTLRRGYVNFTDPIRTSKDALTEMVNMALYEDGMPGPRHGLIRRQNQPIGKVLGGGTYIDTTGDKPVRYEITMQVPSGSDRAKVYRSIDSRPWELLGGSYDPHAAVDFCQGENRVYISNGTDLMSFLDIKDGQIKTHTKILPPGRPSAVVSEKLRGTTTSIKYYITASNAIDETNPSEPIALNIAHYRNSWEPANHFVDLSWPAVQGARGYSIYIQVGEGDKRYIASVTEPKFRDDGKLIANPFAFPPRENNTAGIIVHNMLQGTGKMYAFRYKDNPYRVGYTGAVGDGKEASFSSLDGGGWVDINFGGRYVVSALKEFRDGRGNSAITVFTRGAAEKGDIFHITFERQDFAGGIIVLPNVQKANGNSGSYSAAAVLEARDTVYYPTGRMIKATGTRPNMVNVLVTTNVDDTIAKYRDRLNLEAMSGCVGIEYNDVLHWAMPAESDRNSEIWPLDLKLGGAWYGAWQIPAKLMWMYEDNQPTPKLHFTILTNDNRLLEFSKNAYTADDGRPFASRLRTKSFTFDASGQQIALIERIRLLLLGVRGRVTIRVYGLPLRARETKLLCEKVISLDELRPHSWDAWLWGEHSWDDPIDQDIKPPAGFKPLSIEVGELVSQLSIEVSSDQLGTDYRLHSCQMYGQVIPKLYQGDV